ncbi:MAG: hypothetical protein A2Y33_07270 [Spirochaetes bacterium GWF1_51_8]|nr:MAG: hypothetical protein A2Y33_07270 [Spirochaetes bacterium GWF1_51_8]
MTKKQTETIQQIRRLAESDQSILGLILCGSLAKKTGNARSDIDVIVIVSDEFYKQRKENKDYFWGTDFDSEKFPVEVDGKIVPKGFLIKVRSQGTENIKHSLLFSEVIFSKDSEIENLLKEFKNELENEFSENSVKIKKFYSMMKSSRFSYENESNNLFLKHKLIHDTIYYACRLVLTKNNMLFPCEKNMFKEIETCGDVPQDFPLLINTLLKTYAEEDLVKFYDVMEKYIGDLYFENRIRKGFVLENEMFWFHDTIPYYFL